MTQVYEILQPKYRKSPEDICRNLNLCFPPPRESTLKQAREPVKAAATADQRYFCSSSSGMSLSVECMSPSAECMSPSAECMSPSATQCKCYEDIAYMSFSCRSLAERKADALKVVQMTDIHIEPEYVEVSLLIVMGVTHTHRPQVPCAYSNATQ